MSKHEEFILTPITTVMKDAVLAGSGIGDGIETYPISSYIMQSLFLRMTGFQEQKMKCVAWEMATHDFEYRRNLMRNKDLGEYSAYQAKNSIFKSLKDIMSSLNSDFKIEKFFSEQNKQEILDSTINAIKEIFDNTNLAIWAQNNFLYFSENQIIESNQFLSGKEIFKDKDKLIKKYMALYNQRNRLAHNALSYQNNLPTLATLEKENDEDRNYFVWFAILVLIDNIFIKMYFEYKLYLDRNI